MQKKKKIEKEDRRNLEELTGLLQLKQVNSMESNIVQDFHIV